MTRNRSTAGLLVRSCLLPAGLVVAFCVAADAQESAAAVSRVPDKPASVALPAGYVIGPADVLSVIFWRDREMSADVVVRPDGKITLPLLNDVPAAGLAPEALAQVLEEAAAKFVAEPNATVIVREINSRKVYVVGEVGQPGAIPLTDAMNVLQLIAMAGGLLEHADKENIVVVRQENGREQRYKFNYKDVVKGKRPAQNILLKPGDTVVVR